MARLLVLCVILFAGITVFACAAKVSSIEKSTSLGRTPPKESAPGQTWESTWNSTVASARKEGKVTLYGETSSEVRISLRQAFKSAFGIELENVSMPTIQMQQKVLAERRANLYLADAIFSGTNFIELKKEGMLAQLEPFLILPEAKDPSAWYGGSLPFLDKDRIAFAQTGGYWSYILINTRLVSEGQLKSYRDLLKPEFKGKIIMFDPTVAGAAVNWVAYMLRKAIGPEEGRLFLEQLAARQDITIIRDKRLQVEWVAQGKYAVAIAPSMQPVTEFIRVGAPISWIRMSEGGLVHPSSSVISMPKILPHPSAAAVFINWLLTSEGQKIYSRAFGQPSNRLGIPVEGIDPFTVPVPGEKNFLIDEDFIVTTQTQGREIGKEIFGHLLK